MGPVLHEPSSTAANYAENGSAELREPRHVPIGRGIGWIGDAWRLCKLSPWPWLRLYAGSTALYVVLTWLVPIALIPLLVIYPLFVAGFMLIADRQSRGTPLKTSTVFELLKARSRPLLMIGLLLLVVIAVAAIVGFLIMAVTSLGIDMMPQGKREVANNMLVMVVVFFAIVFAAPLMMAVWFAPTLIVLHDVSGRQARKLSFMGCRRNILPFVAYAGVFFAAFCLLVIAGPVPLLLGSFVVGPLLFASMYAGYRDIFVGTNSCDSANSPSMDAIERVLPIAIRSAAISTGFIIFDLMPWLRLGVLSYTMPGICLGLTVCYLLKMKCGARERCGWLGILATCAITTAVWAGLIHLYFFLTLGSYSYIECMQATYSWSVGFSAPFRTTLCVFLESLQESRLRSLLMFGLTGVALQSTVYVLCWRSHRSFTTVVANVFMYGVAGILLHVLLATLLVAVFNTVFGGLTPSAGLWNLAYCVPLFASMLGWYALTLFGISNAFGSTARNKA